MKKTVWASVIGAIVVACALVAGALFLLRPAETGEVDGGEDVASRSEEAPVAERPDCVAGGVGGVELPCLGGAEVPGEHKPVTVVNVWAWWCEPCRAELPVLERYADNHPDYDVVGVHADANAANGAAFLNDIGVELSSYQDDSNAFAGTLGLPGVVPITVVFRDGQKIGALAKAFETEEELARAVEEVLAGNA
ncbi:thiol-disulfide isomerase [Corynebacterium imitans]|uniref:Thiol-disulfide isomerase n=1 Tax=Corynebacterium imitans TaxID=156978 RepID=A0A076NKH1_9CORY|nr:TlpA disulfide reductase family protein [Corynebacterium imitans]AIJ32671.1 hypothetical protein CIMIT_00950 [Corynebacterium imitans]SNV55532.1 thiol-disulfide isomerase [Corynebacterium imitans]